MNNNTGILASLSSWLQSTSTSNPGDAKTLSKEELAALASKPATPEGMRHYTFFGGKMTSTFYLLSIIYHLTTSLFADDSDDDDVVFVGESTPTADQKERAEKLGLPPTFFCYENKDKKKAVIKTGKG